MFEILKNIWCKEYLTETHLAGFDTYKVKKKIKFNLCQGLCYRKIYFLIKKNLQIFR